jgi:hypothetical protein
LAIVWVNIEDDEALEAVFEEGIAGVEAERSCASSNHGISSDREPFLCSNRGVRLDIRGRGWCHRRRAAVTENHGRNHACGERLASRELI